MPHKSQRSMNSTTWKRIRGRVLRRDGYICAYCGQMANTVDHILPVSKGGTDDMENLVAACTSCNSRKSNKLSVFFLPDSTTSVYPRSSFTTNGSISHD